MKNPRIYYVKREIQRVSEIKLIDKMLSFVPEGVTHRLIYATTAAVFIDPCQYSGKERSAIFLARVDVAIVLGKKRSKPAVVVLPAGQCEDIAGQIFKMAGVHVIRGDLSKDATHICNCAQLALCAPIPSPQGLKTVTTLSERWLLTHAKESLFLWRRPGKRENHPDKARLSEYIREQNRRFHIFHEIRLDAVFQQRREVGKSGAIAFATPRDDELGTFMRSSRFDALITTAPPSAEPLIAVEFDGPSHEDDPEQRERDKKKNEICELASLPLVRVKHTQIPSIDRKRVSADEAERLEFSAFLEYFYDVFTEEAQEHLNIDARQNDLIRKILITFEELKRLAKVKAGVTALGGDHEDRLLRRSIQIHWEESNQIVEDVGTLQHYPRESADSSYSSSRLQKYNAKLKDFNVYQDASGSWASAVLKRAGFTAELVTPTLQLTVIAMPVDRLTSFRNSYLYKWLADEAVKRLRKAGVQPQERVVRLR